MLGFRYLKQPPTTYILLYRGGKIVTEGAGLSFFYFAPTAEIVQVSVASVDVPFVFNEATADFQDATIQGELTFRIKNPRQVASLLDFSVNPRGQYRSDDPSKLNDRLVHSAQILARSFTQRKRLQEVLVGSDELVQVMLDGLRQSPDVETLGLEVLGLSVLSIKGTPEMTKALQAEAREQLLRRADEAVFARRNSAVELERQIKENELNTEIAVEQKKRQVRETQMQADVAVEQQRSQLVDQRVANERKESAARADALRANLEPLKSVDWRTLLAASSGAANPKSMIALAFRDLADQAGKIGNLNISPDLLSSLLDSKND